ncbi:MAG TPA: tRNA (adenosine(37)-N6)-dimethylallyltransferase MiaA [Candidatus Didemnitutus sp.]
MRLIHVLTGCTAAGKTELALRWSEACGGEIVSCDSLLFYRGLDIGTAKPTPAERARVPHHLIDVCGLRERMDVTRFVALARTAVDNILGRGRQVLVTGGSGFYLKAFFAPVADGVDVPAALREEIRGRLEREGLTALLDELVALNPAGLGRLDVHNPRRVVRALERCRASGRALAELQAEFEAQEPPFADCDVRLAEIGREPAELDRRIEERVHAMMEAGLVEEVRAAIPAGLRDNPSAAGAIGYRETLDHIDGRLALAELVPAIVKNTRALVKKQRTWFRTQLPAHATITAGSDSRSAFSAPR